MKKTKFLKVMSILEIIGAVFYVLMLVLTLAFRDMMESVMAQTGGNLTFYIVLMIGLLILSLAAAVLGFQAKNYKATLGVGILMIVVAIAQIIYTVMTGGTFVSAVTGLIVPVLYTWAAYQAEA